MGKHLTIEEKLNAPVELQQIKAKLPELRLERSRLKYFLRNKYSEPYRVEFEARIKGISEEISYLLSRRKRLVHFLSFCKNDKRRGMKAKDGVCYRLFGKKRSELTPKEVTEYTRVIKQKSALRKDMSNEKKEK